ncbi:MAG: winged helix-turn-helix transcriptional regulator [Candidatus Omnitrophica bacterium]|nr:winged helix-turn-helix transcriptional regulator [Candidatus Omnitrophota bacterium]
MIRRRPSHKKDFAHCAEMLKALAHPTRLMILQALLKKKGCVKDLEKSLAKPQANISQHLAILRKEGIIGFVAQGKSRCYYLKEIDSIEKIFSCVG